MGFLPESAFGDERKSMSLQPRCGECKLDQHCESPKMPVYGEGRKGILVVAEWPGITEDKQGRPLVGKAGQKIRASISKFGIDLDRDTWQTNANVCYTNETPTDDQIDACRPLVFKAIRDLSPNVILLCGDNAVKSVIGWVWKEQIGEIGKWVGFRIPCHDPNAWVCPTWHPSYVLRTQDDPNGDVIELWFERHLKAAVELAEKGKPWDEPPDYRKRVRIILDPTEAAAEVRKMINPDRPVAWDLETSSLKPDGEHNFIYSCALSDGKISVSYPWLGEAIQATKDFVISVTPKYGFSTKFEDRWIKSKLGVDVNNWVWDGLTAGHVLDNRRGICSLKTQAFLRLGQPDYDSKIKPYLKSEGGGYSNNRIRECNVRDVLLYGGLDALLEFLVAKDQMKEAGYD